MLTIGRCYTACIAAGGTLGGTAVVVGVPAAIAGIGFTSGGIAAGSTAASMMAAASGKVAAGTVLQARGKIFLEKLICTHENLL